MIIELYCSTCPRIGMNDLHQQAQLAVFNSKSWTIKTSFHLLFHILGRYHEHQRPDRDQYIKVQWGSIKKGDPS